MTAEAYGRQLLDEVKEENLLDLFASLRRLDEHTSGTSTSLPILQGFIEPFLLSSNVPRETRKSLSDQPVIELCGLRPCSGKTQLLCYIIALLLLPKSYNEIQTQGSESAVALIDLSGTFPILRFSKIMKQHIISSASKTPSVEINEQEISNLIHSSFQHLHVFRPQSSASFLATVDSLPSYFLDDTTKHYSANRRLSAIITSDLDAFYWQDRQASQEAKDAKILNPQVQTTTIEAVGKSSDANESLFSQHYRTLVKSLQSAQRLFDCPVIATTSALSAPQKSQFSNNHRQLAVRPHLPSPWNKYCTVKLLVQRRPVPRFPPEITVQEAMKERKLRQDVVEKGECFVGVDWWAADTWSKEVREVVGRMRAVGFRVSEHGVHFGEE